MPSTLLFIKAVKMNEIKTSLSYSDTEIIGKILDGEVGLYELLIRKYNPVLYKLGRSYNYNHEDTQDLMQDTFINAYVNLANFEGRSTFKTWIIKIMLSNCFHKRQKKNFRNEVANEMSDKSIPMYANQDDPDKTFLNRELNYIIENALKKVPLDYRMVFSMREINGLNVLETAEALNISEANVRVRLNRAKAILKKEIAKSYAPEELFEFNLIYCDVMVERVMSQIKDYQVKISAIPS